MARFILALFLTLDLSVVARANVPKEARAEWVLPIDVPHPENNVPTPARIRLGERLFFDPALSGGDDMSCATCHNPALGWADDQPTAIGHNGKTLGRATPTIVNAAYNTIQMWDGREPSLESQALGPMLNQDEMHADLEAELARLRNDSEYVAMFEAAYPGEGIRKDTLARAIASYERTVIVRNTPFDRWAEGDDTALSAAEIRGFEVFTGKGRCDVCHSAPNFTDNGFHNVGLASGNDPDADPGRFQQKPIGMLKGAFKTPTLRDVERTAPYFHDGSVPTLEAVVAHYVDGGAPGQRVSPNMEPVDLSKQEQADLVAFMRALTSPPPAMARN